MIAGKLTTIARPYASAAFEYALQKNALSEWEGLLKSAAVLVEDKNISVLLDSPEISAKQLSEIFTDILAKVLDKVFDREKRNFIRLLAENKRLPLLPDITVLFASARAEHEKNITVEVISAAPLEEIYQKKLIESLTKRLQRQVTLHCEVDSSLLGGAILRAGDMVIDGSIRGKLNRLLESL